MSGNCMTCWEMYGNGREIGTMRSTMRNLLHRTQPARLRDSPMWFGAAPGSVCRETSDRPSAATVLIPGATVWGFVVLGKCFLDTFFFFLYGVRSVAPIDFFDFLVPAKRTAGAPHRGRQSLRLPWISGWKALPLILV